MWRMFLDFIYIDIICITVSWGRGIIIMKEINRSLLIVKKITLFSIGLLMMVMLFYI